MRRVVVTGLGLVSPTGTTAAQSWERALSGPSSVDTISLFDASEQPVRIAAEVRGFDPTASMDAKEARQSSRFVQLATAAVKEALRHSGVDASKNSHRYGCFVGVGMGSLGDLEQAAIKMNEGGPTRVSPFLMPFVIPNMAAGFASIKTGLQGPNFCPTSACASGAHAIGEAFFHIVMGTADAIVAGGAEANISRLCMASFAKMKALSTRNDEPGSASRPFDLERDGFVMGEGCGVLMLEEYEHARRRGADIVAEIVGYGLTGDAYHITGSAPEGRGAALAMSGALQMAQIAPPDVDYINAHGTSTPLNDVAESQAIETVFGAHAPHVSISSTKAATGHCLGAAGGIEAAFTALAVKNDVAPPTLNYATPDPQCRLDYTPNQPRERRIQYALSNSCGFGGQNACLAFKKIA